MRNQVDTVKKGRALIVEDDDGFRKALEKVLVWNNFEVRVAPNGLAAKTILDLAPDFDVVISDVNMPELDGVGLLQHIRSKSKLPVVLISGAVEEAAIRRHNFDRVEFLRKPFKADMITNAIERCLHGDATPAIATPPGGELSEAQPARTQYCPIHIDEFISTTKLHSDVYVKLTNSRFIKVAHKGETIPVERLKTYRDKQVEYLYVTFEDFGKYVDFTIKVASTAMKSNAIKAASKAKLLKHTSQILVERCFLSQIDESVVQPAKQIVEDSLTLISDDEEILNIFTNLQSQSDRLYAHSVAVAVFSAMVAKLSGWRSSSVLFKVCLAGFFHDIGYKELDPELVQKRRIFRSPQEVKLLETHTSRSRDLILQLKSLPGDISMIAYQHHETSSGTGYPLRLTKSELHPLARLIGTVDRFVERIIPISGEEPEEPKEALHTLSTVYIDDVDAAHFASLSSLFKR